MFVSVLVVLCLYDADAQLTRGAISGVVKDQSGAVIQEAQVLITNEGTNETRRAVTNDIGIYRLVAVEPGLYRIEFLASGFDAAIVQNLVVRPAQEVVLHKTISVRGEQVAVEVQSNASTSELLKATPAIQRTFGSRAVEGSPTSPSRDINRLALRAPLVARAPGSSGLSANGQRARQNNFLIDGTDNNDLTVTGPSARVIPEAVGEFQVQAPAYSAEFGRNTGAQVLILTPRGTNLLHGQIWDYFRANWMEPVSLANKRSGRQDTPRFVHHQAGGKLGGPLSVDRTFFFALGEVNRRREGADARNAQSFTIPTAAGFAALFSVPLRQDPPQSPASRQAIMDVLRILPQVYQEVNAFEPARAQQVNGVSIEMGTARIPLSNSHNFVLGLGRLDHRLDDADFFTYRSLVDKRSQPDAAGNKQFGSRFSASSELLYQSHSLGLTRIFTPNWVNEFRFAYTRTDSDFPENDPSSSTIQIADAFTVGGASGFPQGKTSSIWEWQNLSTTHKWGRHAVKVGLSVRLNQLFNRTSFDAKGTWIFQNFADFLNNRASTLRQSLSDPSFDARQTSQAYFVQDDFRATQELTFSLGLRYEYSSVPFGFFGAATPEIAQAGVPSPALPDRNNVAPRFGFAYSPETHSGWQHRLFGSQQTVFRGGFGIAYDVIFYNILAGTALNFPRVQRSQLFQPATVDLFPTLPRPEIAVPNFNPTIGFVNTPTDIQNPTTHFWSFSIQRQVKFNQLLEIGYSGNRSYHLLRLGETNPGRLTEEQARQVRASGSPLSAPPLQQRRVNPSWGSRATIESTAVSKYHALFLKFEREVEEGLLFGATSTWSGTFSDNDEPLAIGDIVSSSPHAPQDFSNYKNEWSRSVFDRTLRVTLHWLFDLPKPTFVSTPPLQFILSGWRVGGFSEWESGQPFTVTTGVDSGGSGFAIGWRPDFNPYGMLLQDPESGDFRTFTTPAGDVFLSPMVGAAPLANSMPYGGNLGRNTLRGPAFANWDITIMKQMTISERLSAMLRADVLNILNHRNFGNPVATMNSPAFGTNRSDPGVRTILLALKLLF